MEVFDLWGRLVELLMFMNIVQALAFGDGLSYAAVWDLRLHGKDTSREPWCRYVDQPNPYAVGPHDPEIPMQRSRPVSRWKVKEGDGARA